jgi:hypothetical protein
MILIITVDLLQTARPVTPIAGLVGEERVEPWPTRMFTNRRDGCSACGVSREFG